MDKAIVTGSSGVIGRVLVDILLEHGVDVLGIDKKAPDNIDELDQNPLWEFIKMDIAQLMREKVYLSGFLHSDIGVFHLAAEFERTEEDAEYYTTSFHNNVLGTHTLLEWLDYNHVKPCSFIFASSYLVYDAEQYLDRDYTAWLYEQADIHPRNMVGAAKYFNELEIANWCANRGIRHVNARIFRVYGHGSRDVISKMVHCAITGEPFIAYATRNRFDFVLADDVAEALWRLANANYTGNINVGTSNSVSIERALQMIPEINVVREEQNDYPIEDSAADVAYLGRELQWVPSTAVEEGIAQLYKFQTR